MKTRGVFTTAVVASLMLAPVFARAAAAAPMAVRSGAPLIGPMGGVRVGTAMVPSAVPAAGTVSGLRARVGLTSVLPRTGFRTSTPLPGNVLAQSLARPLGGMGAFPVVPLRIAPLPSGMAVRVPQFAPSVRRVGLPRVGNLFTPTPPGATTAGTQVTASQASDVTPEPVPLETGLEIAPLNQFPLTTDATSVGELPAPLDMGPLPPGATSILPGGAALALSLEEFVSTPADMPVALPPGVILSPFEAGVVPLPPTTVTSLPQVTFAPLPPGITDSGLPLLP